MIILACISIHPHWLGIIGHSPYIELECKINKSQTACKIIYQLKKKKITEVLIAQVFIPVTVKPENQLLLPSDWYSFKLLIHLQSTHFRLEPRLPESLATASAANTAVASWRVSTIRIPNFSHATRMGEMWPPTSVNTNLMPWAWSTSATLWPPCRGLFLSTWEELQELMLQDKMILRDNQLRLH